MTVLEYVLNGLEAELELERELGLKSIDFDRTLLTPPSPRISQSRSAAIPQTSTPAPSQTPQSAQSPATQSAKSPAPAIQRSPATQKSSATRQSPAAPIPQSSYDFIFLHDRPLSGKGQEMISKITAAMGRTPDTAPVIVDSPRPDAKIYVVLGDRALKKWFPGLRASPGMWISGREGETALVTYSPNFFLRFGEVTPTVKKIKSDMWNSLKGVLQRLALMSR